MSTIVVDLPIDRTRPGTITVYATDGAIIAGPYPALGKADSGVAAQHANPTRDPTMPYGDTPVGDYGVAGYVATGGAGYPSRSYGPNGAIVLSPIDGQAEAAALNGRSGLLIHGGDLSDDGALRATNGCVRVSNPDMADIMTALITTDDLPGVCSSVSVQVSDPTFPDGVDSGEDSGDPPRVAPADILQEPPNPEGSEEPT